MFAYNIIAAEGIEAATALQGPLYGMLPQDKLKGVQEARDVLVKMLERLNQAGDSGWGNYPVVPAGGITKPRLKEVTGVWGSTAKYIEWPAVEYVSWQVAFKYLTDTMGLFGSEAVFPLGDASEIQSAISTRNTDLVNQAPVATKAAAAIVTFLLKLQRSYSNLPEHPRIKGAPKKPGKAFLGGISPWTIVGLLAAVTVGGALIYARKKDKWPFGPWPYGRRPASRPTSRAAAVGRAAEDAALLWQLSRWNR